MNMVEKAAHALAMTEVLLNIEGFKKIASFEKVAKEKGFSDEQIEKFESEKFAGVLNGVSTIGKALTAHGALLGGGAAAGAAGVAYGKHKGKKEGYNKALDDVNSAFADYNTGV
jgi:hypothetical protein